jgi:predicted nucleic acid-binding protein
MPEPLPVVNASPLLVLGRAGRLDLLKLLGERVLVPDAVATEVRAHSDEAARALDAETWIEVVSHEPILEVVSGWDLGAGESAVLSWALTHPGALAILDDYAARKCAGVLGVKVMGTLGLALLAKKKGVISEARPLVSELCKAGLYLSDPLIRDALALVGE